MKRQLRADIKSGKQLTVDHWLAKYTPIINHIDIHAGFGMGQERGSFFETYGEELEFVIKTMETTPKRVWTVLECEGEMYLTSGCPFINRFGYFISEQDVQPEDENIDFIFD